MRKFDRGITRNQFLVLTGALALTMGAFFWKVSAETRIPEDTGNYVTVVQEDELPVVSSSVETTQSEEITSIDLNNYTYPFNTMSADLGVAVYEDGFRYYEIPQELEDAGGCFPEVVQAYLWYECKEYGVDYYTVLALIERESGYCWDKLGDNGNSKGYMQIYEKWHTERMEAEGVTDLLNPYQNIRVGLNCLREIQDKYLVSSGESCVLMVYNMGESTAKKLWAKDIYSSAYSREVIARAQELRQELTQE